MTTAARPAQRRVDSVAAIAINTAAAQLIGAIEACVHASASRPATDSVAAQADFNMPDHIDRAAMTATSTKAIWIFGEPRGPVDHVSLPDDGVARQRSELQSPRTRVLARGGERL